MFGIKSPSLLIRISHLIFIQILFIFSALALVYFYPEDDITPSRQHSILTDKVKAASNYIFHLLGPVKDYSALPHNTELDIKAFIADKEFISNVDLVYYDRETGASHIIQLTHSEDRDYYAFYAISSAEEDKSFLTFIGNRGKSFLSTITDDGEYINYFVRPQSGNDRIVLILRSPNLISATIQNNQAYLLLILFLISALISLLIIYLISDGIKKPLALLGKGFEKTAEGREFYIEETGDKQIRSLTCAFNNMSRKLAQKQSELAKANYEMVKANQNLIESESILTKLVDYSPDAIIVTDLDDHVIIYNQTAAREFGYDQSNMTGKKMGNFISMSNDSDRPDNTENGSAEMKEIICRRRDGTNFPALLVHTPLGTESSKPIAILYFIKSISESENYQDMILKLDRIATRGKMARDIAHEINNYLAILQGNLELIPMMLAKNDLEKLDKKVSLMKETVGRISNFTDGLTRFSDENTEFVKEDLNQLIENLIAFLKPQNKFDDIAITTNLADNMPLVEIDTSQIQHLLVNLINNGAEAVSQTGMENNKWIVISTSYDEYNQEISIKVSDGGLGIKDEFIDKLFVSRFSTKRQGTGFGLITCKNIVDNHDGEVSYHTSEESKSVFTVKIPVIHAVVDSDETIEIKSSKLISS